MNVNRNVLIYILRNDLRLADNPAFHAISSQHPITHLVPLYVFNPAQYEVSGFISSEAGQEGSPQNPFPEARSRLGKFWRCGPFRAKFLAESLFDLKRDLREIGSDLVIRIGKTDEIVKGIVDGLRGTGFRVQEVCVTKNCAYEEMQEERAIKRALPQDINFRVLDDESTLIHRNDLPYPVAEIPDVFTTFRKGVEPLRTTARLPLEKPTALPSLPDGIQLQPPPFVTPEDLEGLIEGLQRPLLRKPDVPVPPFPEGAQSAHPLKGGSESASERLSYILKSEVASSYKDTRNGLLGTDFSTKLSAYLAHGCISARQIHSALMKWEDDNNGGKDNKGTAAIRFELLWRDYMRYCLEKYGTNFFELYGFGTKRKEKHDDQWKTPGGKDLLAQIVFQRWLEGRTTTGLIDAAQRELLLTGYTSNRTRQNVASFLSKHLQIDWRLGAEWYESMLVDYDCASNWGNWAYVAGVGNDPREGGQGRVFNPVKQASDYDPQGEYIKAWVEESKGVRDVQCVWQLWKLPESERKKRNIGDPLVKINWSQKGGHSGRSWNRGRGRGRARGRGTRGTGSRLEEEANCGQ